MVCWQQILRPRCNVFNRSLHPVCPPLVMVNQIVFNLDCKVWQNLQVLLSLLQLVMKFFTVTDCKSYTTDCKSDGSACKFCQSLQLVTIARTTIQLTIRRRGAVETKPSTPQECLKTEISDFIRPGGGGRAYWVGGGQLKSFTGVPELFNRPCILFFSMHLASLCQKSFSLLSKRIQDSSVALCLRSFLLSV